MHIISSLGPHGLPHTLLLLPPPPPFTLFPTPVWPGDLVALGGGRWRDSRVVWIALFVVISGRRSQVEKKGGLCALGSDSAVVLVLESDIICPSCDCVVGVVLC